MQTPNKTTAGDANLHLMSSIRSKVEAICADEGVTLNEFVNVAVAEKLAHYQHMEWVNRRLPPDEGKIAEARRILRKPDTRPPDPGDELPEGYVWPEL